MAFTMRVTQIEVYDPDGIGPVKCQVSCEVSNDDATTVALKANKSSDAIRECVCSRVSFNAFVNALRRPNTDNWRDDLVSHPVTKLP